MRQVYQYPTVKIEDGKRVEYPNPPVTVYDTSGPYTDPNHTVDINKGLSRERTIWIEQRDDTELLPSITSEYGRRRLADASLDAIRFPIQHRPRKATDHHRAPQKH